MKLRNLTGEWTQCSGVVISLNSRRIELMNLQRNGKKKMTFFQWPLSGIFFLHNMLTV